MDAILAIAAAGTACSSSRTTRTDCSALPRPAARHVRRDSARSASTRRRTHLRRGRRALINDERFIERAEIIREKGTNRSRFFRGEVDKYTWVDVGSSYLLSDVNAAILCAQIEHRETIQARRRAAASAYPHELTDWADSNDIVMPHRETLAGSPDHLFPLLLPDLEARTRFLAFTREQGVATTFHYIPLHSSPAGERFGTTPFGCPTATDVSDRLVRLPLFSDITENEVDTIIEVTRRFTA